MSTGKVDVLAVMHSAGQVLDDRSWPLMEQAHAAVAELIEAARGFKLAVGSIVVAIEGGEESAIAAAEIFYLSALDRLNGALAKVQP